MFYRIFIQIGAVAAICSTIAQAASPTPPPPPPPELPRMFIVFFGSGKCTPSPEAEEVIGEVVKQLEDDKGASAVEVVGHTDSFGTNSDNQKLSECRADAVKAKLEDRAIGSNLVTTSGKGESELMVQTGDQVKEPQNRRATMTLGPSRSGTSIFTVRFTPNTCDPAPGADDVFADIRAAKRSHRSMSGDAYGCQSNATCRGAKVESESELAANTLSRQQSCKTPDLNVAKVFAN